MIKQSIIYWTSSSSLPTELNHYRLLTTYGYYIKKKKGCDFSILKEANTTGVWHMYYEDVIGFLNQLLPWCVFSVLPFNPGGLISLLNFPSTFKLMPKDNLSDINQCNPSHASKFIMAVSTYNISIFFLNSQPFTKRQKVSITSLVLLELTDHYKVAF